VQATSPERFRFVRELGAGGMGAADLVYDAIREETVARKRCHAEGLAGGTLDRDRTRRAWARLKREFRALAELRHPSIVSVYELGEDSAGVYFTMEVVDGIDLYAYCRGGAAGARSDVERLADTRSASGVDAIATNAVRPARGELSLERLVGVLPSLLEGLAYLHARGLVHRDLKPSNVLVERDGRARILDFGILAELSGSAARSIAGTSIYMAPEQIRGLPPATSIDLYALGVTLFEIVAGEPPFVAQTTPALFLQHLRQEPPRLTSCPPALADAVHALLSKEPAGRPSIETLASALLPALGARPPELESSSIAGGELVGRNDLQRRIAGELESDRSFEALVLQGPTGVGKSALAAWAAAFARARGYTVLSGRARQNELLAFNAIDGIVDDLADAIESLDDPEIGHHRRRASVAFPVLGRPHEKLDASSARAVAFDGVIELLSLVARLGPGVLLAIDDVQWADADSIALLLAIAERAPSGIKMIVTLRDDLPASAGTSFATESRAVRTHVVPPLDVASLAAIVARSAGGSLDREAALRIGEQCAGRAYFAEVAGRLALEVGASPTDFSAALAARLADLSGDARNVLATVSAAEGWIRTSDVASALGLARGAVDAVASELAELAVLRRTGGIGADQELDLYHDVARDAATRAVGAAGITFGHAALADLLDRRSDADPLVLVRHLAGAGRRADAARRAADEAKKAESRRAYGLAAELYSLAASGWPERALWMSRSRITALIRAGSYETAIAEIERLESPGDDTRASLEFDRSYALFMAGKIGEGLAALDRSLALSKLRPVSRGGLHRLPDLVRMMAGPRKPARRKKPFSDDPIARERRERDAEVALLLTWEEPFAALSWAVRARAAADASGQPERGAFADYLLAFLSVTSSGKAGDVPVAARYLACARDRAAPIRDEPHIVACDGTVRALMRFRRGEFREASDEFVGVARALEEAGHARTHTHLLVLSNTCGALMGGELTSALGPAIDAFEQACPPAQGAMEAHTLIIRATHSLYVGDRERYRDCRARMRQRQERDGEVRFYHVINELFGGYGELFWGDPIALRASNERFMKIARRFRPLSTYFAGGVASILAVAEAAALRLGDRRASVRKIDRWAAIARAAPPFFISGAVRAQAYVADHQGRPERALELLREAEAIADRYDQRVSRGIARYQRGIRIWGEEGAELVTLARADLASAGARDHLLEEDPVRRGAPEP
jgi:serine/threonine protein kinase